MSGLTIIGKTDWRNTNQLFGIKDEDRFGHIYCIGRTGSGKSTLLLNMAVSDIQKGNGIGVIDPHGDLAEELLNFIPKERMSDVIYFNATDTEFPIAFNPFANIKEENRYLVSETIVMALKKLWSDSWGPRLEHILRNTLLSLSYYPKSTLLDIVPMLTDSGFRKKVSFAITVISLQEFWQKEFETLTPQLKSEFIAPIINKVGLFNANPILRNILGQSESLINISESMNSKKIFIANLSKGVLGETGTQLLGSLLVTQFQAAALARANSPIQRRTPFYLYIDEVHSFLTKSFVDVLSEARKYKLSLFLTHQFMEQLSEDIQKAILGNVGTLISFRVGTKDAKLLAEEFYPKFAEHDLINLPRYHIYLKLLIDGTTSRPFSAITLPTKAQRQYHADEIIRHSRNKYAKEKSYVEDEIQVKYQKASTKPEKTLFSE
jgi:hypothetical protein